MRLAGGFGTQLRTLAQSVDSGDGHTVLALVGFVPGRVGVAADLTNAGLYFLEGDTQNALIALACTIIPAGVAGAVATVATRRASQIRRAALGSDGEGAAVRAVAGNATPTTAVAAAETATASKPLIIGENMSRVKAYAQEVGWHAYRPWTNSDFALGMQRNGRMIKDVMRADRDIIDIGPDFARRAAGRDPSDFYNLERQLTDDYANYTSVFKRFGKLEGGVSGLDY